MTVPADRKRRTLFSAAHKTVSRKKADYIKLLQRKEAKGRTFVAFEISSVKDESLDNSDYRIFDINGVIRSQRQAQEENRFLEAHYQSGEWHFQIDLQKDYVITSGK